MDNYKKTEADLLNAVMISEDIDESVSRRKQFYLYSSLLAMCICWVRG